MRNSDTQKILVTAALPYANGKIHLGHLAGAYLPADIYVRFQRSMHRDVLFICGSDEHGVPITLSAEKENTTPHVIVDRFHFQNKEAFAKAGMSFDHYGRTSIPLHHDIAKEFFLRFHSKNILKEKSEQQWYDEKNQMFLPDRYIEGTCPVCGKEDARGDQCEKCCSYYNATELIHPKNKISGETPSLKPTTHWYFPLGEYQQKLENYIAEKNSHEQWKENVLSSCQSWFKDGLRDRAVTRDLQWGVRIPLEGYENKVLYVWFDAVLGYISASKEWSILHNKKDEWKKYWLDSETKYVAFIGKDNIVFHCIVFPAMLMAWNETNETQFVLPANVPANEFLNFEGEKFSKSKHWGIDVDDFLSKFPADMLRYALAMNMPENKDADFYWKDFQAKVNGELADILGNFVHRKVTFIHKNFAGKIPPRFEFNTMDNELISSLRSTPDKAGKLFEEYHFRDAILEIMNLARSANKYFNYSAPWHSLKNNQQQCATTLHLCIQTIRTLAILLAPVLPFTSEKMYRILNLKSTPSSDGWEGAKELVLGEGHCIGEAEILFTKIENETIAQQLKIMESENVTQTETVSTLVTPLLPTITIDEFKKIDLRVAKILACEKIPKS